jgi:DNA-binding response OmpR family regulator
MTNTDSAISVLYVEDDETIAYLTKDSLILRGYSVEHAGDGATAFNLFRQKKFHLCIIDIMLPVMDGWTLAQKIRKADPSIPIIFLSAKSLVEDKIKGLSLGADDYITKPFSIDELVLRMEVFLKRSAIQSPVAESVFIMGDLSIDFKNQCINLPDCKIELTQRENELLHFLINQANRVVKREEILKEVWGDNDYFLGRSLDVFISRLRKILISQPEIQIQNIHGVGFRLAINKSESD